MNTSLTLANSIWYLQYENKEVLKDLDWIREGLADPLDVNLQRLAPTLTEDLIALRKLMLACLQDSDLYGHLEALNQYLKRATYRAQLTNHQLQMISDSPLEDLLVSEITRDFIQLFIDHEHSQLKQCDNDECQFFYLDQSKNQSKKYCSSRCNNLIKVRRHREKKKKEKTT